MLQWRKSEQAGCGNATAGCLDEVGIGDGKKCHLAGHLEVEVSKRVRVLY